MKKVLSIIICLIICFLVIYNLNKISNKILDYFDIDKSETYYKTENKYYKDYDFLYVQRVNKYVPYGKQDMLNIIYSMLNNGWDYFSFNCPSEYEDCIKDFVTISDENSNYTDNINNFVSPFNSYKNLYSNYSEDGEITLGIEKLYSDDDIIKINKELDRIINEVITDDMDENDKILKFHDYIINNTKYDVDQKYDDSHTAMGLLFNHIAVCSGYADVMALFLDRLNIKNYKVTSDTHSWNAVYINDEWVNLDLTWDDPVTKNSTIDTLQHDFFLIKKEKLLDFDIEDHKFDTTVFQELN